MTRIIQGLVLATLISAAQAQESPFPKNVGGDLKPLSTYADAHAADANRQVSSAIPGDGKLESIGD